MSLTMREVPRQGVPVPMSEAEWQARVQLAACYRLFDQLGWTETIFNHITLRVPGPQRVFPFYGAQLSGAVAYHVFEGITVDPDERARVLHSIADKKCVILRNHGLLSRGRDIAEAFLWLWTLQRACDVQIAAPSAGALHPASAQARAQCVREAGPLEPAVRAAVYAALVRKLHRSVVPHDA